jgi:NAD(P)-dependent dehydrogenase (short-subunit alcohol dehydrogenase family)
MDNIYTLPCKVSDEGQAKAAVEQAVKPVGRIDVVVK